MTRALFGLLALGALGAGCSFEAPESEGALSMNTCSSNEQCGTDGLCNGSMCVARTVSDSLRVYLHVAPLQQPDGPAPVATLLPELTVERGATTKTWMLAPPPTVFVTVRNGDIVVDADVTLTAQPDIAGLPVTAVTASIMSDGTETRPDDFEIRIPKEGEYTVRVQPKDTSLPPYEAVMRLDAGDTIPVDYAGVFERTIEVSADIEDKLVVRAHDLVTGAPISSTADLVNKQATLRFMSDPGHFRLVVRPAGAYEPGGLINDGCDHDTPVLPTFSIASSALDDRGGMLHAVLPPAPERASYEGNIELCSAPNVAGADAPQTLPVTLRSSSIILDDPTGMWTAEVETSTEALIEDDSGLFDYCVDVFPGAYEVVVTPPESKPCEIFAEAGVVLAPDTITGMKPKPIAKAVMQSAAQLIGEATADMMPLVATTVDVQSLGRPIMLDDIDAALTRFSRSRQTTTDETGAFRVAVDRGSYDVTVKPPSGSGYAWYIRRNVEIGSHGEFTNDVEMSSPVAIDSKILYDAADQGDSTAGAQITAYAVIEDDKLGERAIAIGKAVADDNGQFMLLLPPKVLYGWSQSGIEP